MAKKLTTDLMQKVNKENRKTDARKTQEQMDRQRLISENMARTNPIEGDKVWVLEGGEGGDKAKSKFGKIISENAAADAFELNNYAGGAEWEYAEIFIQDRDGKVWGLGEGYKVKITEKIRIK